MTWPSRVIWWNMSAWPASRAPASTSILCTVPHKSDFVSAKNMRHSRWQAKSLADCKRFFVSQSSGFRFLFQKGASTMAEFLVEETAVREAGESHVFDCGENAQ